MSLRASVGLLAAERILQANPTHNSFGISTPTSLSPSPPQAALTNLMSLRASVALFGAARFFQANRTHNPFGINMPISPTSPGPSPQPTR